MIPFTCELYHALNASTKVLRLSSKKVAESLGDSVLVKLVFLLTFNKLTKRNNNEIFCFF